VHLPIRTEYFVRGSAAHHLRTLWIVWSVATPLSGGRTRYLKKVVGRTSRGTWNISGGTWEARNVTKITGVRGSNWSVATPHSLEVRAASRVRCVRVPRPTWTGESLALGSTKPYQIHEGSGQWLERSDPNFNEPHRNLLTRPFVKTILRPILGLWILDTKTHFFWFSVPFP